MFSRIIPAGERPRGTRRTECFFCDGRSFLTWRHFVPNGCCVKIPLLVSACLAGEACRYDGASKPHPVIRELVEQGAALPVCPECLGGSGSSSSSLRSQGRSGIQYRGQGLHSRISVRGSARAECCADTRVSRGDFKSSFSFLRIWKSI